MGPRFTSRKDKTHLEMLKTASTKMAAFQFYIHSGMEGWDFKQQMITKTNCRGRNSSPTIKKLT